jgi:hypothetical protein
METEFCLNPDGSVNILIEKDGLPSLVGVVPLITYSPEDRLKKITNIKESYVLRGMFVEGWKWIKNPVFDKKGEKTTVEFRIRMCKNKDEALIVASKVKTILEALSKGESNDL